MKDLIDLGVQFDADRHGDLALGLEGGHSRRRIIHAGGSATGRRILRGLVGARSSSTRGSRSSKAAAPPRSSTHGGVRLDGRRGPRPRAPRSSPPAAPRRSTRARPTRPARSARACCSPARRARCSPTSSSRSSTRRRSSASPGREGFLISEAVRGEGATLHDEHGERFVNELDPRDAVARAIFNTLQRTGAKSVGLDMTMVDPGRFPNVVAALQEAGLDPTTQRVPVAPASHYVMGGIVTDLDGRATGVERLYAVGECACTGLHGANRLASNSLSECFVFGRRAALEGARRRTAAGEPEPYAGDPIEAPTPRDPQGRLGARRPGAQRARTSTTLADDPYPLARLVAVSALAPPGDARLARPRRVPGARPRPRRAPHDPRPRHATRRASSHGPPDRLGRRAHDEHARLLRRVPARARAPTPRAAVPGRPGARGALVDLECGRIDIADVRAPRSARALGVDPDDLAERLTRDVRPDQEMLRRGPALPRRGRHDRARVSNSWREDDYDVDELFDVDRALGPTRHPQAGPADLPTRRRPSGRPTDRCVFVDDLGGNLKPAKALGMTTIRHTDGFVHDRPARASTFAVQPS